MVIELSKELSKPVCRCPRCEWEQALWKEYVASPWLFDPVAKAKRDKAMYEISPGWCQQCEVFNDCACGERATLTDNMECGGYNPCEKHLLAHKAWQAKWCRERSSEEELLAQEWIAIVRERVGRIRERRSKQ